jgi:hypothetical protein
MNRMARMRAGSLVAAMTRDGGQRGNKHAAVPVAEKLASEFARLAGAKENALALVQALRNGDIAPTGPMGWMDVKISLVLVQDSLAHGGSSSPTPEELDAALKDVLWMRAGGMGWGRIAFVTARASQGEEFNGKGKGGG